MIEIQLSNFTIIIPTFNRNEYVLSQVKNLLSFDCIKNVKIIVIDNCSNIPVSETFNTAGIKSNNLLIKKNISNLGVCGNILEAFRICETKRIILNIFKIFVNYL